jgi:hypothetical protein
MVGAVLAGAKREIRLAQRDRGAIDQHLLGAADALSHDAGMLGARRVFSPTGKRSVRQGNLGRGGLDPPCQLLEQALPQARKRRQHVPSVPVLGLDVDPDRARQELRLSDDLPPGRVA